MTAPRVTVLMAVHDGERFLPETLRSIAGQTLDRYEFLIIDDCSSDGTPALLAAAAQADSRIRILRNETNLGLTRSLNRGLAQARGEYIARIDADDLAHPERLARQVAFLDRESDHVVVGACEDVIDEGGKRIRRGRGGLDRAAFRYLSAFVPPIAHSSACIRASTLRESGLAYDEELRTAQDFDLWLRLQQFGHGNRMAERLVSLREHGSSISSSRRSEQAETAIDISARELARRCPDLDPDGLRALAAFIVAGHVGDRRLDEIFAVAFAVECAFLSATCLDSSARRGIRRLTVHNLVKGSWRACRANGFGMLRAQSMIVRLRPLATSAELCAMAARRLK